MPKIVEKVAVAIWQARMRTTDGEEVFSRLEGRQDWIECARAAIQAMKDPSTQMRVAGRDALSSYFGRGASRPVSYEWQIADETFAAMISAALEEG